MPHGKRKKHVADTPVRLYEETRDRLKPLALERGLTMAEFIDRLSKLAV